MSNKPDIEVVTIESQDHPLWQVLVEQRDELKEQVPIFSPANLWNVGHRTLLVARLDQCIVGITSITNKSFRVEDAVGVGFISTHKQFRNMGVATAMVKALFTHAELHGKAIANTPYEPEGKMYLEHVMQRVANKYPTVELIERDYSSNI